MTSFSATDAKNKFGVVLDAAQRAPVTITKQGRQVAVVLSQADYEHLVELETIALRAELVKGIESGDAGEFDVARIIGKVAKKKM
jgi:prevent-host-death family protein